MVWVMALAGGFGAYTVFNILSRLRALRRRLNLATKQRWGEIALREWLVEQVVERLGTREGMPVVSDAESVGRLLAWLEAPERKSLAGIAELQSALISNEEKLAASERFLRETEILYQSATSLFPSNAIARVLGLRPTPSHA